jgi:hypothetical protein
MRKMKMASDFAKLTYPDLKEFERFSLLGIRWDMANKEHYREPCINRCKRNPNLKETNLANLENKRYRERGFFFGDNFCFDFSIYYVESLIYDIAIYKKIRG